MKQKKRKKKIRYTMLLVPDNAVEVKRYQIYGTAVKGLLILIMIVLFVSVTYMTYTSLALVRLKTENQQLTDTLLQTDQELRTVQEEQAANDQEMQKLQVTSLQQDEGEQAQQQEKDATVPSGLPLDGTTGVPSEFGVLLGENEEASTVKGVVFSAAAGTNVVATGSGSVIYVGKDNVLGNMIKIDHQNGYVSIYCNDAEVKVQEGAQITRGTALFEISGDGTVDYGILYENEYLDPMTVMEIAG